MKGHSIEGEGDGPDLFTAKQCQVLDLLIERKTSKEIARILGISPYTVDQRISLARAKLGVSSRNELAARYQQMVETRIVRYDPVVLNGDHSDPELNSDGPAASLIDQPDGLQNSDQSQDSYPAGSAGPRQANDFCPTPSVQEYRVGPEVFEGSSGGLWRFGAIVATALLLVMTILVLFAVLEQINDLLA